MIARRTLAAAAVFIAASTGAACSGTSPTMALADQDEPEIQVPGGAAPTDTAGFIPAQP